LGMGRRPFVRSPAPDTRIFERAGIAPGDVDVFMTHDACSPAVWMGLERYGYAAPGEAADFVEDRGIAFDEGFPINPHGGSLSAGQLGGWLNVAEAVTQLRGEAGARQVPDVSVVHYGSGSGDTIVLTSG
ncbi:MAG TPA: hypothetical protein VK891_03135, partial [Euzebyales bacterium]|nr:hypothetical protein [Euzebyales bacterium]